MAASAHARPDVCPECGRPYLSRADPGDIRECPLYEIVYCEARGTAFLHGTGGGA